MSTPSLRVGTKRAQALQASPARGKGAGADAPAKAAPSSAPPTVQAALQEVVGYSGAGSAASRALSKGELAAAAFVVVSETQEQTGAVCAPQLRKYRQLSFVCCN